jgi:beta-lactamase regulating signal transducer with metallopeptidase domain
MMFALVLESAARTMVLAIVTFAGLKVLRVRSIHAQLAVWTAVLLAALAMPLLMQWNTVTLPEPSPVFLSVVMPARDAAGRPAGPTAAFSQAPTSSQDWSALLAGAYAAIAAVFLLRLLIGLALTWRLYRLARSLRDVWTHGADVRVTSIDAPVTFGSTILIPEDYGHWSAAERQAVISHERSHIRRADFYIQLLAGMHRAIFWFSPLAWWLSNRLVELAEMASDDATIEEMSDRPAYAEILLGLTEKASRHIPPGVGMARPRTVGRRVERILSETRLPPRIGSIARAGLALGTALVIAVVAGCSWPAGAQNPSPPVAPTSPAADVFAPVSKATYRRTAPSRPVVSFKAAAAQREEAFGVVIGSSQSVFGTENDPAQVRSLRDRLQADHIWFEKDQRLYYVSDPGIVERVRNVLRPQDDLSSRQAGFDELQARLREQRARLREQSDIGVPVPDLSQSIQRLQAALSASSAARVGQPELRALQAEIDNVQAGLIEAQVRAGAAQAELAARQAELETMQARLGAHQSALGEQQARSAAEAQQELRKLIEEAFRNGLARPIQ